MKVIAQGTGQALDTGRRGDADVVFVHAKSAEQKFLAEGLGVKRYPVMYNDFVLIGPKSDPAGIKGMKDVAKALQDDQGQTGAIHIARRPLRHASRRTRALEQGRRHRHREGKRALVQIDRPGHGRGAQHGRAPAMAMCCPTAALGSRSRTRATCKSLVEGDKRLFNQYGVMLVNPAKHPNVKKELGQQFIDWLVSPEGQKAIADYKINGEQLFYPNASDPSA